MKNWEIVDLLKLKLFSFMSVVALLAYNCQHSSMIFLIRYLVLIIYNWFSGSSRGFKNSPRLTLKEVSGMLQNVHFYIYVESGCHEIPKVEHGLVETVHSEPFALPPRKEQKWKVLIQEPYSPDLLHSKYYLLLSVSNVLRYKTILRKDDLNQCLETFFSFTPKSIQSHGIERLPENDRK